MTAQQLSIGNLISSGAESSVYQGTYHDQRVAVKRPRIGTAADLDRFRQELCILASLQHDSIIRVLAAKALPPGVMVMSWTGRHMFAHAIACPTTYLCTPRLQPRVALVPQGCQRAASPARVAAILALHPHHRRPTGICRPPRPRPWHRASVRATKHKSDVNCTPLEHPDACRDIKTGNLLLSEDDRRCVLIDFGIAAYADSLDADLSNRTTTHVSSKPSGGFHKTHMVWSSKWQCLCWWCISTQ